MLVQARALNGKMLSSTGYSLLLMYCRASVSTLSLSSFHLPMDYGVGNSSHFYGSYKLIICTVEVFFLCLFFLIRLNLHQSLQ